jgi:hypothetical protein
VLINAACGHDENKMLVCQCAAALNTTIGVCMRAYACVCVCVSVCLSLSVSVCLCSGVCLCGCVLVTVHACMACMHVCMMDT